MTRRLDPAAYRPPAPYLPHGPHRRIVSTDPYVLAECPGGPLVAWWAPYSAEHPAPLYLYRQCGTCGAASKVREDGVFPCWRDAVPRGQTVTLGAGLWDREAV